MGGGPITRTAREQGQAPRVTAHDKPSANMLWLQSLHECGQLPGQGNDRTQRRYRSLLRVHGLLTE